MSSATHSHPLDQWFQQLKDAAPVETRCVRAQELQLQRWHPLSGVKRGAKAGSTRGWWRITINENLGLAVIRREGSWRVRLADYSGAWVGPAPDPVAFFDHSSATEWFVAAELGRVVTRTRRELLGVVHAAVEREPLICSV